MGPGRNTDLRQWPRCIKIPKLWDNLTLFTCERPAWKSRSSEGSVTFLWWCTASDSVGLACYVDIGLHSDSRQLLAVGLTVMLCNTHHKTRCRHKRDVIVQACRRVLAARPPARPEAGPLAYSVTDDDRRKTPTDASEQNNTGPLGGPVRIYQSINAGGVNRRCTFATPQVVLISPAANSTHVHTRAMWMHWQRTFCRAPRVPVSVSTECAAVTAVRLKETRQTDCHVSIDRRNPRLLQLLSRW